MIRQHEALHLVENAALDRVLRRVLAKSREARPANRPGSAGPLQILDLACGPCREAGTLANVFRDFEGADRAVRLVGADIRDTEIKEAAARAGTAGKPGDRFEFLTADCARLGRHRQVGRDFDVTFLRHQNYWNDRPVWERIFDQGLELLKEDGLLVITSYFDTEHALALKALEGAGAQLLVTGRNDHSRVLGTPGKSVDRHVAVFRKKR